MTVENKEQDTASKEPVKSQMERKLKSVGWGIFFIWIGLAIWVEIESVGILLGIGVITLGMQAARKFFKLKLEVFWVVVGLAFVAGSFWDMLSEKLPLVPLVLIAAGLAIVLLGLSGKRIGKSWK